MDKAFNGWLSEHRIERVEAMSPDPAGLPRGKILPTAAFLEAIGSNALRFPSSLFLITVDGGFVEYQDLAEIEEDLLLVPDRNSLTLAP